MDAHTQRRTLSRRETCERLGISLSTLNKEIQSGRLRAFGKKVLIPVEAETEWLAGLPAVVGRGFRKRTDCPS
jgi:excisionase family DNA binding protein